jgi:catechol 2,3-dioxygenase-like lactoylglutathione lyase family enzyme
VARILALDHVQVAIPEGGEARARDFYCGALGLEEMPKPASLQGRGGCWFGNPMVQLHAGVDPEFRAAQKAHPALIVEGLDEIVRRCAAQGSPTRPDTPFGGYRRVHVFDPFGNRIELMENQGSAGPLPSQPAADQE